jgi:membrane-bound lytic murein transglycosylase A
MKEAWWKILSLAALLLPPACRPPEPPPVQAAPEPEWVAPAPEASFFLVPAEKLPLLWDGAGEFDSLVTALELQRGWLSRQDAGRKFRFGDRQAAAAELLRGIDLLLAKLAEKPDALSFGAFVAANFDAIESVGGRDGQLLVTGYYEPILEGSRTPSPEYPVPIYGPPGISLVSVDLGAFDEKWRGQRIAGQLKDGKLVPYADRKMIRESGMLRGKEIAWAKDKVDAFFLEVQGSGTLRLPDGGELRIGYAGANGRPYRSIGKALIDQGKMEKDKVSMQTLRAWLNAHPEEMDAVFDQNGSFVFFRVLEGAAVGSLGLPVTAGRSVAADPQYFPQGAFAFLLTEKPRALPDGTGEVEDLLTRFVVVQDTGGAIRGPGRIDFFWGRGHEAGERAGVMKQPGRIFLLLPKLSFP